MSASSSANASDNAPSNDPPNVPSQHDVFSDLIVNVIEHDIESIIRTEVKRRLAETFERETNKINSYAEEKRIILQKQEREIAEFENCTKLAAGQLEEDIVKFENDRTKLEEARHEHNIMVEKQQAVLERALKDSKKNGLVTINIGGKKFQSFKHTLANISIYFANLFSDKFGEPLKDDDGHIFIDRSPYNFENIINWSRDGNDVVNMSNIISGVLKKDGILAHRVFLKNLDYFGINYNDGSNHKLITQDVKNLFINNRISVYWFAQKTCYKGYILSSVKELPKLRIEYYDGEIWDYNLEILLHESGPHKNQNIPHNIPRCMNKFAFCHYGKRYGARRINL